jgi:hypothetical protein
MRLRFNSDALAWMGSHGFGVHEVSEVEEYLSVMRRSAMDRQKFLVPQKADEKVSALISILYSITDVSGMPTCFKDGEVVIPAEAKKRYEEALSISKDEKDDVDEQFGSRMPKARSGTGLRGKKGR